MHETFRLEYVPKKKKDGTTTLCGPYWYAYRREAGKLRKRYIGKNHNTELASEVARPSEDCPELLATQLPDDQVVARLKALDAAWKLLGIDPLTPFSEARRKYRELARKLYRGDRIYSRRNYLELRKAWKLLFGERR